MNPKWLLFIALTLPGLAQAAPCCGGASAIPSLISGDDRAQMALSYSQAQVIGDMPVSGPARMRPSDDLEQIHTLRIDTAYLLTESVQLGLVVPVVKRSRDLGNQHPESTGLGDVRINAGYEFLPEISYSPWKPRGFIFLTTTLPTGPSIYDARADLAVDARGRGFLSVGPGVAFFKTYRSFDFTAMGELHQAFTKTMDGTAGGPMRLSPGWGGSALVGVGYSPGMSALRLGVSVSPVYEGPIEVRGQFNSQSQDQLVWNTSFQAGYLINDEWTASASYADQTLLGQARNVELTRSVAMLLQKRWQL